MTSANSLLRLARAVHLDAQRTGGGWCVSGGAALHLVSDDLTACDCADFVIRGGVCKHQLAARLASGDAETLRELRALIAIPRQRRSA